MWLRQITFCGLMIAAATFSALTFAGNEAAKHLQISQKYSRPANENTERPKKLSTFLLDMKYDDFLNDIWKTHDSLKSASKVELDRLEIQFKHILADYQTLLERIEGLDEQKEEVRLLQIEIKTRLVLAQSIKNQVAHQLNNLLLEESIEAPGSEMSKTAPKLFDASAFPRYQPPPIRERPTIEPQK